MFLHSGTCCWSNMTSRDFVQVLFKKIGLNQIVWKTLHYHPVREHPGIYRTHESRIIPHKYTHRFAFDCFSRLLIPDPGRGSATKSAAVRVRTPFAFLYVSGCFFSTCRHIVESIPCFCQLYCFPQDHSEVPSVIMTVQRAFSTPRSNKHQTLLRNCPLCSPPVDRTESVSPQLEPEWKNMAN